MPKANVENVNLSIEVIVECTECGHKFHFDVEDGHNEMQCSNCFEQIVVLMEATPYVTVAGVYNSDEEGTEKQTK